jgi:DNA-binding MarR family transcriptional regulator
MAERAGQGTTLARPEDSGLEGALGLAVMRLSRRLRSERTPDTLTASQLSVLGVLERTGPLSPSQLAAKERVQPPSMSRVVTALEQMGLVDRHSHESDGRQSVIALSLGGRDLLAENRSRRQAWLAGRLDELSPGERQVLSRAVAILEGLTES